MSKEFYKQRRVEMAQLTHSNYTLKQIAEKYSLTVEGARQQLLKAAEEGCDVYLRKYKGRDNKKIKDISVKKIKTCELCNIQFEGVNKYCSKECLGKSIAMNRKGGIWSKYETIELKCSFCDKNFKREKRIFTINNRNKPQKHHFCSKECFINFKKKG